MVVFDSIYQFFEPLFTFFATMGKLVSRYWPLFMEGTRNTLILALFTVVLGTLLGIVLALMRMGPVPPLRWFANGYIEFIRGTPLLVQLMFLHFGLPMAGIVFPAIPFIPDSDRFMAGIIAMAINSGAYVAEIIRSGIQAVDAGQTEAARSLGFSQGQTLRMVVLPQAVKNILPALGNEFVTMIKESSIVSVIGVADLMYRTNGIISNTWKNLEALTIAALIYFVLTFITSRLVALAERRMSHGK